MTVTNTSIQGVKLIDPNVFHDDRGYFFETYNRERYRHNGILDSFVQDNEALSQRGVLRGLHYQVDPHAQAKLVRVTSGAVFDVVVDIRVGSASFGSWYGVTLSAANKYQLYVPAGLAHGYLALEDDTILCYKCSTLYARESEGGMRYDDPAIGIDWPAFDGELIISEKDLNLPGLHDRRT